MFLALLGSHLLDDRPYFLVGFLLLLVEWKKVLLREFLAVLVFVASLYIMWIYIDTWVLNRPDLMLKVLSQGLLILLMYLLGLSVPLSSQNNDKIFFYFIYIFIFVYVIMLVYSYAIPYIEDYQREEIFFFVDNIVLPLPHEVQPVLKVYGLKVCFPNEYERLHVNGGYLISTIIAYYLSIMALLLPMLLFGLKRVKSAKFTYWEIGIFVLLAIFALYLANEMGRRTVLVLFAFSFVVSALIYFSKFIKYRNTKGVLLAIIALGILGAIAYYFLHDTLAMRKLLSAGLHDKRFSWWGHTVKIILDYPFGGGHSIYLTPKIYLAHNTWLDIGKDYGVIPFITFMATTIFFAYIVLSLLFSNHVSLFLKQLIFLIATALFAIFMIEPVFASDKTFFAYVFFFFGLLVQLHKKENKH